MKRREFISLIGVATAWPLAARAQQPADPVLGFLGNAPASGYASRLEGLRGGLRETGFVDGSNVAFEFRYAETSAQLPALAAELVERNVAAIICSGNYATRAAKAATSKIPILFSAADDPVKLGFVASFNRPGGNVTGLSLISGALGAKRLELLRAFVPKATVIALMVNPNNPAEGLLRDEQAAARDIGQRIVVVGAASTAELEAAFVALVRQNAEAILINADSFFTAEREPLVALAARHRLPAIYAWREFAEAGGLMSYGTSLRYAYHQIGQYAGRILKGEKPADLPVMQPTKFEFVINLRTARALGREVPDRLLALADEVIE